MDREKLEYLSKILGPGTALVKDPRYPEPFIIKIPLLSLEKNISDEEVLTRLEQHLGAIYHPSEFSAMREAIRMYQGKPPKVSDFIALPEGHRETSQTRESPRKTLDPEAEAVLSLHSLISNLFDRSEQIFAKAGITSGSKKNRIKSNLLARNFIREHKLQKGKTFITLWEITPQGWTYLGKEPPSVPSKGGFLHQASAHFCASWAGKKGFGCEIEKPVGANMKQVDLVFTKKDTGELVAVEICTSEPIEKELKNIKQDLAEDTGISKVILLATDASMKRKLEGLIREELELAPFSDRIQVLLIGQFID
jgi:hypothetical protein